MVIIDSYDKSKLQIPKYPHNRTPKRTVYELCKRFSIAFIACIYFLGFVVVVVVDVVSELLVQALSPGVSLTLTCVIAHGHGTYFYVSGESQSAGSSWQWECVSSPSLYFHGFFLVVL